MRAYSIRKGREAAVAKVGPKAEGPLSDSDPVQIGAGLQRRRKRVRVSYWLLSQYGHAQAGSTPLARTGAGTARLTAMRDDDVDPGRSIEFCPAKFRACSLPGQI